MNEEKKVSKSEGKLKSMIKSIELKNIIKNNLEKDEILENDINNIKDLSLNKYKFNGMENDIDLEELKIFKNLKTLTLINFSINKEIIKIINEMEKIWAIQFSNCKFEEIIQLNKKINYVIIDYCENVKMEMINGNNSIRIIGSEVDLQQLKLDDTEILYLQDCNIKNIQKLLSYNNLKLLNLDGSIINDESILYRMSPNIKISHREEYFPVGGMD